MKEITKILKKDEFYFYITIPEDSEFSGNLYNHFELISKLTGTIKSIGIKDNKIICFTDNHSDFMRIESDFNVKTTII